MDNNTRYPKLWQGLLLFVLVIVAMIFVATPVQIELGLSGVAITELILLMMAIGAAVLSKCRLRDIFPLEPTPPKKMFGILMMYGGLYLFIIAGTSILAHFMPSLNETSINIASIGTQLSPAAAILIMAVMPAVCEEAVFRGFILASFKSVKLRKVFGFSWKFLTIILVGVLFGIFHLDPTRYLMTAVLGAFFTYIALESGSMFPSMFLHLTNNLISVIAMYSISDTIDAEALLAAQSLYSPLQLFASFMCYLGVAIMLYFFGLKLFKSLKTNRRVTIAVIITSVVMVVIGYVITVITVLPELESIIAAM